MIFHAGKSRLVQFFSFTQIGRKVKRRGAGTTHHALILSIHLWSMFWKLLPKRSPNFSGSFSVETRQKALRWKSIPMDHSITEPRADGWGSWITFDRPALVFYSLGGKPVSLRGASLGKLWIHGESHQAWFFVFAGYPTNPTPKSWWIVEFAIRYCCRLYI